MIHDDILNVKVPMIYKYMSHGSKDWYLYRIQIFLLNLIKSRNPAIFYFDHSKDIENNDDLLSTGQEFLENNILDIPYPECAFIMKNHAHAIEYTPVYFCFKPDESIINFLKKEFESEVLNEILEYGIKIIAIEALCGNGNIGAVPYIGVICNNNRVHNFVSEGDKLLGPWAECYRTIVCSSMFLCTKYADITKHEAKNSKLNIKRLQKNKKHDYYTVTINHKMVDGSGATGTGTKKKPHWRRGHIRHLASGKIIPVMPCLINFSGEDVDKKVYISNESNEMKKIANQINELKAKSEFIANEKK